MNLSVALALRQQILSTGARVVMTRVADTDCLMDRPFVLRSDLIARADTSNDLEADLFVSLHHNDAPASKRALLARNRTEVYFRMDDEGASFRLGQRIFRGLDTLLTSKLSEVIPGAFAVLRYNKRPSILGEPFYMTTRIHEEMARSPLWPDIEGSRYMAGIGEHLALAPPVPRIVRPAPGERVTQTTAAMRVTWSCSSAVASLCVTASGTLSGLTTAPSSDRRAKGLILDPYRPGHWWLPVSVRRVRPQWPAPTVGASGVTTASPPTAVTTARTDADVWVADLAGLPNGPILLEASALGVDGGISPATRRSCIVAHAPASLTLKTNPGSVDPDYAGPVLLEARLEDHRGWPVADGTIVRVLSRSGAAVASGSTLAGRADVWLRSLSVLGPGATPASGPAATVVSTGVAPSPHATTALEVPWQGAFVTAGALRTRLDFQRSSQPVHFARGTLRDRTSGHPVAGGLIQLPAGGAVEGAAHQREGSYVVTDGAGSVSLGVDAPGYMPLPSLSLPMSRSATSPGWDLRLESIMGGALSGQSVVVDADGGAGFPMVVQSLGELLAGTGAGTVQSTWQGAVAPNDRERARVANRTPAQVAISILGSVGSSIGGRVKIVFSHGSPGGRALARELAEAFRHYAPGTKATWVPDAYYFLNTTRATTVGLRFGSGGPRLTPMQLSYILMRGLVRSVRSGAPWGRTVSGRAPLGAVLGGWVHLDTGDRVRTESDGRFLLIDVSPGRHTIWFQTSSDAGPGRGLATQIDVP